jgi:hypothetical protein
MRRFPASSNSLSKSNVPFEGKVSSRPSFLLCILLILKKNPFNERERRVLPLPTSCPVYVAVVHCELHSAALEAFFEFTRGVQSLTF